MSWPRVKRFPACDLISIKIRLAVLVISVSAFTQAAAAEDNPQDLADVQAVCTRCHTADAFLSTPRSWRRWNDVFQRMMEHGATGTDSQLAGVTEYFLIHLTIINVNTSPPDEIEWTLHASPQVRDLIVARRANRKFTSIADLKSVPGIDQSRVQQLKDRILF